MKLNESIKEEETHIYFLKFRPLITGKKKKCYSLVVPSRAESLIPLPHFVPLPPPPPTVLFPSASLFFFAAPLKL